MFVFDDSPIRLADTSTVRWTDAGTRVEAGERASGSTETLPDVADREARIGHLSDLHVGKLVEEGPEAPAALEHWLTVFHDVGVDLCVVSGDLVETPGDRVGLIRVRQQLDASGLPWVVVPGNHDVAEPGRPGAFGELFGSYPRVERHAGLDVVLFDSMGGFPADERGPYERLVGSRFCYMRGRIDKRQLARASARLGETATRPRLLVLHHHLAPRVEIRPDAPPSSAPAKLMVPLLNADRLLEWASRHDVQLIVHGHRHRHWPCYVRRDIPVFNTGSATRGKPQRRARLVDWAIDGARARVYELAWSET
jgi:3',5'-cyclic AMP phosphodiesterase CpdA